MSGDRSGTRSGRRAVLRWAWRLFRREWRQQLLVLILLTVAVTGAVAGAAMASAGATSPGGRFATVGIDATTPQQAQTAIAAARHRFGPLAAVTHVTSTVPGSVHTVELRGQDPQGMYGHGRLALRAGRYPRTADEVALTDGVAKLLSASVGERVDLGGRTRSVVGRVENPADLNDDFALVPLDLSAKVDSVTLLVQASSVQPSADRASRGDAGQAGGPTTTVRGNGVESAPTSFRVMLGGTDKAAVVALVLVVVTLAMALVCLIAAAGFVVVAQRRQRQLGLLAAIGATERHLRLVVVANGAIVGATAAVVGGALGIVGWLGAAPAIETGIGHRVDRWALPWGLIAECLAIAVVAATAAAWWPARAVTRVPVMEALSRRPSRPLPVQRSLLLAAGLVAVGVGAITAARTTSEHVRALPLIAGVLALVVGVVLAAPAAIRALAAPAARLPLASRLALRDLVRYQSRAAAALAAITLALGLSASTVIIAKASQDGAAEGNLSNRELIIRLEPSSTDPGSNVADASAHRADAARVAATVGHARTFTLEVAMNPAILQSSAIPEPIAVATPIDHGFRGNGAAYVATPQLLRHVGLAPADIKPDTELLTSEPGNVVLLDIMSGRDAPATRVQRVDLPRYSSGPSSLITEQAMRQHGWMAVPVGWLVESPTPLTRAQITSAQKAAAGAGLTIEGRDAQDGLATLRTVATGVGALLGLLIVGMTIGLLRGESGADLQTLTATGATGRTRRSLAASTAGAMAVLGAVLGTAGAYAALLAGYHAQLGKLSSVPVTDLLLLAVGFPVLAAAGAWLLAGREPRTYSRQALD